MAAFIFGFIVGVFFCIAVAIYISEYNYHRSRTKVGDVDTTRSRRTR